VANLGPITPFQPSKSKEKDVGPRIAGMGTTTQIIDCQRAELKKFLRASVRGKLPELLE
jgi:hypothetical protein